MKTNIPSEEKFLQTIFECVSIRGIDLELYKRSFINENSGLYDAVVKLFTDLPIDEPEVHAVEKKYSKKEAIKVAEEFLLKVRELQDKYSMSFNSDTGDVYLSFKTTSEKKVWDTVKIGWVGDGTGLKVMEKDEDMIKKQALSKLTDEEKKVLGINE